MSKKGKVDKIVKGKRVGHTANVSERMVKISIPENLKRKIKSVASLEGLSISGYIEKLMVMHKKCIMYDKISGKLRVKTR